MIKWIEYENVIFIIWNCCLFLWDDNNEEIVEILLSIRLKC